MGAKVQGKIRIEGPTKGEGLWSLTLTLGPSMFVKSGHYKSRSSAVGAGKNLLTLFGAKINIEMVVVDSSDPLNPAFYNRRGEKI